MTTKTEAAARYWEVADMPAHPAKWRELRSDWKGIVDKETAGLTIRQEFAARAMAGLLANSGGPIQANPMSGTGYCNCEGKDIAEWAVELADYLIAALEESK